MTAATPLAPHPLRPRVPTNASRLVSQLDRNALVPCAGDARSHARQEFSSLEAWLSAPSTLKLPLHQIERQQQTKGRGVQPLLLQAHLQRRGHEDMGPALCVPARRRRSAVHASPAQHPLPQDRLRNDRVVRMGYSYPGANSIYPLKAGLALPACVFPYELQRRWSRRRCRVPSRNPLMASPTSPACRFPSAAWKTCWWMRPETLTSSGTRPGAGRRPHFGGGGRW